MEDIGKLGLLHCSRFVLKSCVSGTKAWSWTYPASTGTSGGSRRSSAFSQSFLVFFWYDSFKRMTQKPVIKLFIVFPVSSLYTPFFRLARGFTSGILMDHWWLPQHCLKHFETMTELTLQKEVARILQSVFSMLYYCNLFYVYFVLMFLSSKLINIGSVVLIPTRLSSFAS